MKDSLIGVPIEKQTRSQIVARGMRSLQKRMVRVPALLKNRSALSRRKEGRSWKPVKDRANRPLLRSILDELRARFPASAVMATLQCAGHRRDELAAFRPIPGEFPWGAETTGNAVWRGVALSKVLRATGVGPGVRQVAFSVLLRERYSRQGR